MVTDRINSRLPNPLAEHVKLAVSDSDYARKNILDGYRDIAAGNYFKSTGNFKRDMELLKEKENANRD